MSAGGGGTQGGGTQSAGSDPRRDPSGEMLRPARAWSSHRDESDAVPFSAVLDAELAAIAEGRRLRSGKRPELEGDTPEARAQDARLAALAFSGGGIRSATFNLGVAQGLARLGLLRRFDYLSVNSGGGYIGSWLLAWIRRAGLDEVERELRTDACRDDRDDETTGAIGGAAGGAAGGTGAGAAASDGRPPRSPEAEPVSFLRRFSNYLTPQLGAFSADTWTMVTTYLRNLLLNQAVLVMALGALLLLPRLLLLASGALKPPRELPPEAAGLEPVVVAGVDPLVSLVCGAVALAIAVGFMGLNQFALLADDGSHEKPFPWYARQDKVQWTVVLPLFAAAWFGALWMWFAHLTNTDFHADPEKWALLAAALYLVVWLLGWVKHVVVVLLRHRAQELRDPQLLKLWTAVLTTAIPSGALGGLLLWVVARSSVEVAELFAPFGYGDKYEPMHLLHVNAWMAPAVVLVFIVTAFVHTGLMGRAFPEALRQWWSRLGAWLLIWSLTWIGLVVVAIYGPMALVVLGSLAAGAISSGWLLTTISGVIVGRGASREQDPPSWWRRAIVAVAPQIFIVGLLALIALGVHALLDPPSTTETETDGTVAEETMPPECREGFWLEEGETVDDLTRGERVQHVIRCHSLHNQLGTTWDRVLLFLGILGFGALGLSARVDINEFSMHLFYRNRLIRAYLGASNRRRRPHPFTGFDPADDLPLASFAPGYVPQRGPAPERPYDGPYPLLNIALNLVAGKELAWQERKAASFVFSPLHTGFDARRAHTETGTEPAADDKLSAHAFRPTQRYRETGEGISLGTGMAISGAAASPNMGSGSTPAMAFLLTVFNVRLGWWLGNPRHHGTWDRMGPRVGLWALLAELFGSTDDESAYVYLSDGGHFDNLALYELVRRRCRFIVLSDAGADPKVTFDDLGNAIRKCCTDFGIEVDLDVARFRPDGEQRFAEWHCAVGKIRYDKVDPDAAPGVLVYLKASLTGDEPPDVLNYAAEHPEFPHESTADQWFGEAQFESYRKLGEHVVLSVLHRAADRPAQLNPEALFVRLQETWYPPSAAPPGAFSRLAQRLTELLDRLADDPKLAFLAPQLYPEWPSLMAGADLVDRAGARSDEPEPGQRLWLPSDPDELSAGFFYCQNLIQLMQDVYLDLGLETEYDHPDNRGWLNVFKHWSWPGMVRVTWAVTASTCGARFQNFCRRRLGLGLGEAVAEEHPLTGVDVPALTHRLEAENRLNFLEGSLVRDTLAASPGVADRLLVLRLEVRDPSATDRDPADRLAFTYGFALLDGSDLRYLRVQDHLRNMGLGRRSLRTLVDRHGVRDVKTIPGERMPEYARRHASESRGDKLRELFRSVINEVEAE